MLAPAPASRIAAAAAAIGGATGRRVDPDCPAAAKFLATAATHRLGRCAAGRRVRVGARGDCDWRRRGEAARNGERDLTDYGWIADPYGAVRRRRMGGGFGRGAQGRGHGRSRGRGPVGLLEMLAAQVRMDTLLAVETDAAHAAVGDGDGGGKARRRSGRIQGLLSELFRPRPKNSKQTSHAEQCGRIYLLYWRWDKVGRLGMSRLPGLESLTPVHLPRVPTSVVRNATVREAL
eukprot:469335-Amorphochlora_amoeboformis.AAC.1